MTRVQFVALRVPQLPPWDICHAEWPFDECANAGISGEWLSALDDVRNWLIREAPAA